MSTAGYAELHCLSNFSFLRGASHPEELVERARELNYTALAVTDECSVAGVVRAFQASRDTPLNLIIGSEFKLHDRRLKLILLAPDRQAYAQLCRLITLARRRADKGHYQLMAQDLEEQPLDHCLALWPPGPQGLCPHTAHWLKQCFTGRLWILAERHLLSGEQQYLKDLGILAAREQLPVAAAGNVHMHCRKRRRLHDVLGALRHGCTVQTAGSRLLPNAEFHLRSLEVLERLYPQAWLAETLAIAERCTFQLDTLRYEYPSDLIPPGQSARDYFRQLVREGEAVRFPEGTPPDIRQQINQELSLIAELRYEHYFLTLHDVVRFARQQQILCQGRGSAANSVVCYCLGITEVDPRKVQVLFERFISRDRDEPPDIDVDFEHERREEVIQYIYRRYTRERAALAATVICYRPRSAIRDVGKALGLDQARIEQLLSGMDWRGQDDPWWNQIQHKGLNLQGAMGRHFLSLVRTLIGFPRHLSQHVGGFVISSGPVAELVPVENAAMADRTVIQWDKDDLESLGLMKVDILALGMLTAIRKALELTGKYRRTPLRIPDIPPEDPAVYEMLTQGDSIGVFQVESRAQMNMLPRLKPRTYYDLVIEVAIVRPGPIQGDMVHPYLRRRDRLEEFDYPNEAIKAVLERTLGVPIFQEQVIKLAMVAAGFSGGEADRLRRAMAAWKRNGNLEPFREKLIAGMRERGHDPAFAERLYQQICGFGGYGFPESHAASFALLVYISAWLKYHHPAAFYTALLNSQPMGFYSPAQLVQDAKRHQVPVYPVDINHSDWDHQLVVGPAPGEPHGIRLGLRLIKGLGSEAARRLVQQRPPAGYRHTQELADMTRLGSRELEALASAGAYRSITHHRHQARWDILGYEPPVGLFDQPYDEQHYTVDQLPDCGPLQLPVPTEGENILEDYDSLGLSLERHPLMLLRERQLLRHCLTAEQLQQTRHGQVVRVAGLVTGRQRPGSAAGVTFVTLEDETGAINVVVWVATAKQQRRPLLTAQLLEVQGVIEREKSIIHVVAGRLRDLTHLIPSLRIASRDFR